MKSCLTCGKSKQKHIRAIWQNGEGASGDGSANLVVELGGVTELLKELVEGQRDLVVEMQNLGEVMVWGRDPIQDAKDYVEWLEEWNKEDLEREVIGWEEENILFQEFLKGVAEMRNEEEGGEMEME